MDFFYFVFFIVIIVVIVRMNNKIKALRNQVDFLNSKIIELNNKALFNYHRIMGIEEQYSDSKTDAPEASYENVTRSEVQAKAAVQTVNPYRAVKPDISRTAEPKPEKTPNNLEKQRPDAPAVRRTADSARTEPKLTGSQSGTSPVRNNPQQNEVVRNTPPLQTQPVYTAERSGSGASENPQFKSFESWLGTRFFNVAASLMIFIGLVLFCTLGYEYITNGMKIAAMFMVSSAFIGLGAFFTKRNKSIFSLGLTGCGFGAFFISVLLSHVYFHAMNDVTAFGFLLLWAVFALFMSKKLDSVMLSVTAHLGTAVAICFAFSLGFSNGKIILPVVYQLAAISVIIIGNVFCCKKTYRFGLFMSIILFVYTSVVMTSTFSSKAIMPGEISAFSSVVIFAVQLLALSFVSYLISVSTAHLETGKSVSNDILYAIHIANKFFWSVGMITITGFMTYFGLLNVYGVDSVIYPTFAVCVTAVCHLIVTLFMTEKLNFSEKISKISIWFVSCIVMIALFVQSAERTRLHGVSFLFVYAGLIMLIIRFTKNKKLNHLVSFLIGCDMMFMCMYGYFAAENVVVSLSYMAAISLMVLLHWFSQSGESRERRFSFFKMSEYLWFSASVIPINISEFSDISLPLILSEFALINIIAFLCRYAGENEYDLKLTVNIESIATVFVNMLFVALYNENVLGDILVIKVVFVLLSSLLTLLYSYKFVTSKITAFQVLSALMVSGFVSAIYIGLMSNIQNDFVRIILGKPFMFPLFFVAAILLTLIYRYNGNRELRMFIWINISIAMVYNLVFAYPCSIDIFRKGSEITSALIFQGVMCLLNSMIITLMIYSLWKLETDEKKTHSAAASKIVGYFWINISCALIVSLTMSFLRMDGDIALLVFMIIHVIGYLTKYHIGESRAVYHVVRTCSVVLIYCSIPVISGSILQSENYAACYAVRFVLILAVLGMYYILSREFLKSGSPWIHALIGFTGTAIVNASCRGLSAAFDIAYIFSIVTMITALICIVTGFAVKSKGLRIYGLIVVMLCVIKLVTFDISGADSLSRVAAFVVGGIVCFIISGIYNMVESRFAKEINEKK